MFYRRFLAFLLDVIPITFLCATFFWFYQGFDETVLRFMDSPRDYEIRKAFLEQRNIIRELSCILCIIYFVIFESSGNRNSIGKAILGIKVVTADHSELSMASSVKRNLVKFLAILPGGLGLLYPLFNKERLFFHDKISRTTVKKKSEL